MHGKAFAQVRVKERRLSRWKTALLFLGSPILPFILLGRLVSRIRSSRRNLLAFVRALPFIVAGVAAWCWGEAGGYGACLGIAGRSTGAPKPMEYAA